MKIFKLTQSNHFLSSPESAWSWAIENTDIDQFTEEELKQTQYQAVNEHYQNRAEEYSDKYNEIIQNDTITLYRAIKAPSIQHIDWNNVGTHWSFEKSGAGSYGEIKPKWHKYPDIILTAIINTKYIDWEYCFTSFMYYGEDQWECALDEDVPITITHIDNQPINKQAYT